MVHRINVFRGVGIAQAIILLICQRNFTFLVRKMATFHERCLTARILIVLVVSLLVSRRWSQICVASLLWLFLFTSSFATTHRWDYNRRIVQYFIFTPALCFVQAWVVLAMTPSFGGRRYFCRYSSGFANLGRQRCVLHMVLSSGGIRLTEREKIGVFRLEIWIWLVIVVLLLGRPQIWRYLQSFFIQRVHVVRLHVAGDSRKHGRVCLRLIVIIFNLHLELTPNVV